MLRMCVLSWEQSCSHSTAMKHMINLLVNMHCSFSFNDNTYFCWYLTTVHKYLTTVHSLSFRSTDYIAVWGHGGAVETHLPPTFDITVRIPSDHVEKLVIACQQFYITEP